MKETSSNNLFYNVTIELPTQKWKKKMVQQGIKLVSRGSSLQ